jgi:hypothetical protein
MESQLEELALRLRQPAERMPHPKRSPLLTISSSLKPIWECKGKEDNMPRGYWVGRVDVINPEGYQAYGVALAEVLRKYGAKFLVRGGTFEAVEGKARGRRRHRHHHSRRLRRTAVDGLIASPARPFGVGPRRGAPPTSVRPAWLAASSLPNRRRAA